MSAESVMERTVIHAGKVFIKEGEEIGRAYLIQAGKVRSFKMIDEQKIVISEYLPGTIIGEIGLLCDDPAAMSYEAMVDTTVAMITRNDFDHKLKKADKLIKTVFQHVGVKLQEASKSNQEQAIAASQIDEGAFQMVQALIHGMPDEKKRNYEIAMLPHANGLVKAIKKVKKS